MNASKEKTNCRPDCSICGGVGFIRYDVPRDDSRFGKLFPCPNIPAESPIFDNHGLTQQERTWTWANIKARENVGDGIKVLSKAIKRGSGIVYLYGGPGLAKTLMLKIACAEWARKGAGVYHFTSLTMILEDLRNAYDDDEPQRALAEKERKYTRFPLLAVDEVGYERKTVFAIEKFFDLVNKRHELGTERGEEILTLMCGNALPDELDFRIYDRLLDGRNAIVKLTGESYRPSLKW